MAQDDTAHSSMVGTLTAQPLSDEWQSEPVPIPLFDNVRLPISIFFKDFDQSARHLPEADLALVAFLKLGPEMRAKAEQDMAEYARLCLDAWGWDDPDSVWNDAPFTTWSGEKVALTKDWLHDFEAEKLPAHSVWNMVGAVSEVSVMRDEWVEGGDDKTLYVIVVLDCFFGKVQLVFREGRELTRVGYPDGALTDQE